MATEVSRKVGLAVILLALAGSCYYCETYEAPPVVPRDWGRIGCEEAIKAQLAAPTTTKIEWAAHGANPEPKEPYPFADVGKVTAQNYFGALLTKDFICYHNGKQDFRGKALLAP